VPQKLMAEYSTTLYKPLSSYRTTKKCWGTIPAFGWKKWRKPQNTRQVLPRYKSYALLIWQPIYS
jgi:hypothetical protein